MSHLDEMTCLLYLEGQLERPRALELSAHTDACSGCRALLRALERESHLLAQALAEEDESVPARLLAPPARSGTPWAWLVSFGLAAAGAYTLWTGVVEPWRQQLNQAGFGESNLFTMLFFGGVFWKGWGSMANTVQVLAMTTLGILVFGLVRHTWRRWTTIAMVMSAVIGALMSPPQAGAAEIKKSETYTLPAGEVLKNDLVFTGRSAEIDGTVEGDVITFSQKLTINGRVTGDVISFAQLVRINGPVDGNVRAFANTLSLTAAVGKNVTAFAENIDLDSKAQIGGGMMLFAADTALNGRLNRDLFGFIGRTLLNGFIGGNVRLKSGHLTITERAQIEGKARYEGEHQPAVSPQAKLASPLEIHIVAHHPAYTTARFYIRQLLRWGAAFIFGMLIALLMPSFYGDVVRASHRYGLSLGIGALTLAAGCILALVSLLLLLIRMPVGVMVLLLYFPAIYAAQVFVASWIGDKLLGPATSSSEILGRLALGLIIIRVLGMIPVLGALVWLAVILWGVGALVFSFYSRSRPQPALA